MIIKDRKIYIGTLYVGENELDDCKQSVQEQTFKNIKHEIFSHLPNKEAHDTLYSRFMELSNEYDYFIKLDADMVLVRNTVVEEMLEIFEKNTNLDQAIFTVRDWYSDSDIIGMHMFSNRVRWKIDKESLFVDTDPYILGEKIIISDNIAPVAFHSPNPSIKEAYIFGFHRALKVIQRGRLRKNTKRAKLQMGLLQNAWSKLKKDKDIRRAAVIYGAEEAFKSNMKSLVSKSELFKKNIEDIRSIDISEFIKRYQNSWDSNSLKLRLRYFFYCELSDILRSFFNIKKWKN